MIIHGIMFSTIQSCQPPTDHPLDVDPELFSALLFVAPNYLHTCSTKLLLKTAMTQPEVRGQSSPSPFLQSLNSSLWTARLAPCGPMIVLITSTTQPAQTHVTQWRHTRCSSSSSCSSSFSCHHDNRAEGTVSLSMCQCNWWRQHACAG